jgi:two-component system, cell cycle response regulator
MTYELGKNEFISVLWDNSPDPFWVCEPTDDGDFRLLAMNPSERLIIPDAKEGDLFSEILGSAFEKESAGYRACLRDKCVQIFDQHSEQDGRRRVYRVVIMPAFGPDGRIRHIWGTAKDLSDIIDARERAESAAAELEELIQERTRALETANAELRRANQELMLANERYQELALKDPLTSLSNRRAFNEAGLREFNRSRRYGRSLSLVAFDLDNLKRINDEYGHPLGDEAIRRVGAILSQAGRSADLAARLGGDEFAIILPETELAEASALATRCIAALAAEELRYDDSLVIKLGMSAGAASLSPEDASFDALYARADRALYHAKNSGKGKVDIEP